MGAIQSGEHVERRLAAILAADVAGYSRLMATDEVGALTALKVHRREVVDPAIAAQTAESLRPQATACWSSLQTLLMR
jgi:class 3 adenylate cyclase